MKWGGKERMFEMPQTAKTTILWPFTSIVLLIDVSYHKKSEKKAGNAYKIRNRASILEPWFVEDDFAFVFFKRSCDDIDKRMRDSR